MTFPAEWHLPIIFSLPIIVFAIMFHNTFTLVDDYGTFVTNPFIKEFGKSMASLHVQTMLYTIFIHAFGESAIPHHTLSMLLHLANVYIFYKLFQHLFHADVAFLASALFSIHPVTTEAVVWISGNPYLFNALIYNLVLFWYTKSEKTGNKTYFWYSLLTFSISLIFFRTVWLVIVPLILIVFDQFFINKRLTLKSAGKLSWFFVPLVFFILFYITGQTTERLATKMSSTPLNQQVLTPMIEGIPYAVTSFSRLYLFPKDLMIYYDGNPVGPFLYYSMFVVFFIYCALVIIAWRYRRIYAGILIMLVVTLAPTMGPARLVWYVSERYLYYGTGFFTLGVALLMYPLMHKPRYRFIILGLTGVMLIAYGCRTFLRIADYRNSETLAKATIKTSPLGLRGHDDLANSYLIEGDYVRAIPIYHHSLSLVPDANTPISNLGLIYLQYGIPTEPMLQPPAESRSVDELLNLGEVHYRNNNITNAAYYFYQATRVEPANPIGFVRLADASMEARNYTQAFALYQRALTITGPQIVLFNKTAHAASWLGDYKAAENYLKAALELDPQSAETLKNYDSLIKLQSNRVGKRIPEGTLPRGNE